MHLLYTLLLSLALLLTLPYWVWKYLTTPKYQGTLRERLGHLPKTVIATPDNPRPCLWIHAVSVGETLAVTGLAERLHQTFPNHRIIFSTVTRTGHQMAQQHLPWLDGLLYLPLDLPWIVARVVDQMQPNLLVVVETELWPNLFHCLAQRNIPVLLVNGRISPRSFRRYHQVRGTMARFLTPVKLFAMQSASDGERIIALGAPVERTVITGNIKYDQALILPTTEAMAALGERLGPVGDTILLAASTHPGEETMVLEAFARLREHHQEARLILVPRHPERGGEVLELTRARGWEASRFSTLAGPWETPVLVVDAVGWLARLHGLARVTFVGGSLVPHGGQNPLEPAAWGLAPVLGPHTINFSEAVGLLLEQEAATRVRDAGELGDAVEKLWDNRELRQEMGTRAREVVTANTGAVERTLQAMLQALPAACAPNDG